MLLPFARLSACIVWFSLLLGCDAAPEATAPVQPVLVVQPAAQAAGLRSFPGEVRARVEVELAFRIGGKVIRRQVDVGEAVAQGQLLAELDPQDVRLQLDSVRAQLASAQADQELARAERERYAKLRERQLVSASQFDAANTRYQAAQAQVRQLRAQLDVASNQTEYAQLKAPQAGVIARRQLEVGQVVAAGQGVYTLAADGEREVAFDIPEQSFARFALGQPVALELWSQPGRQFAGHIRELAPSADPATRTYRALVAFDEIAPAQLGQSARVLVAEAGAAPLAVPLTAVSAEQGEPYVFVVDGDGRLQRRNVRLGPYGRDEVPVLDGLAAQDWVVAAGVQLLRDGQVVRALDRHNRPVGRE